MPDLKESPTLSRWRSHKIVTAGEIGRLVSDPPGGKVVALIVTCSDGSAAEFCPGDKFFARGTPSLGDYYVVYGDGYASWSPRKAFEEGYAKISE